MAFWTSFSLLETQRKSNQAEKPDWWVGGGVSSENPQNIWGLSCFNGLSSFLMCCGLYALSFPSHFPFPVPHTQFTTDPCWSLIWDLFPSTELSCSSMAGGFGGLC